MYVFMLLCLGLSTILCAGNETPNDTPGQTPYDLSEQERKDLLQHIETAQAKLETASRQRSNSLHEQKKVLEQQVSLLEKMNKDEHQDLLRMAKDQLELFNRRQQDATLQDHPEESQYRACR